MTFILMGKFIFLKCHS